MHHSKLAVAVLSVLACHASGRYIPPSPTLLSSPEPSTAEPELPASGPRWGQHDSKAFFVPRDKLAANAKNKAGPFSAFYEQVGTVLVYEGATLTYTPRTVVVIPTYVTKRSATAAAEEEEEARPTSFSQASGHAPAVAARQQGGIVVVDGGTTVTHTPYTVVVVPTYVTPRSAAAEARPTSFSRASDHPHAARQPQVGTVLVYEGATLTHTPYTVVVVPTYVAKRQDPAVHASDIVLPSAGVLTPAAAKPTTTTTSVWAVGTPTSLKTVRRRDETTPSSAPSSSPSSSPPLRCYEWAKQPGRPATAVCAVPRAARLVTSPFVALGRHGAYLCGPAGERLGEQVVECRDGEDEDGGALARRRQRSEFDFLVAAVAGDDGNAGLWCPRRMVLRGERCVPVGGREEPVY